MFLQEQIKDIIIKGGTFLLSILGSNLGGVGPVRGLRGGMNVKKSLRVSSSRRCFYACPPLAERRTRVKKKKKESTLAGERTAHVQFGPIVQAGHATMVCVCVCVCVCVFITAVPITKLFARGAGRGMEDMCYERLRAEADVN